MGLIRLILLVVLGAVLYRLWKRWRERLAAQRTPVTHDQGHMLACAHCGTFVPEHDAVREGPQVYCCAAHRDAHRPA